MLQELKCKSVFLKKVVLIIFYLFTSVKSECQDCCIKLQNAIVQNGLTLLNTPYESGTLDKNTEERLTYCNDKFDCVTFIEYVLALSIKQIQNDTKSSDFERLLTKIRYHDGVIDGFGSRLHYFTDWIIQNEKNGYIKNITENIGGIPWQKKLHFMSTNQKKYPRLNHPKDISKIKNTEKALSKIHFHYIPKNNVRMAQKEIQNGDIIAITTNITGLDVVHTGIAILKNGHVHLMHASSDAKKVMISLESLDQYLNNKHNQTGIMVLRPICTD